MDRIQQLNYEKDFRIAFLESKGDGFQRLFEKLMSKAHPNDFIACRPWGNVGDRKNDGYLPSARTLFQSYAPNELAAAEAIKKINEDFEGAKEHWEKYFDEWMFVHNAPDGRLGPHIIEALAKLGQEHPKIKIGHCGYEENAGEVSQIEPAGSRVVVWSVADHGGERQSGVQRLDGCAQPHQCRGHAVDE